MPHEVDGQVHWHEPSGLSPAGSSRFLRPKLTYDRFMDDEAVPVVRAADIADLRAVALQPWRRLGGRGAFLQLFGTEGGLGCALQQLGPGEASRSEKHLCEEIVLVVEGRGTTELRGGAGRVVFEWQQGSVFAIPANTPHRFVNATQGSVLLLSLGNAPALLNQLGDIDAMFANPFVFSNGSGDEAGQAFDDIEPDPVRGLALCRTALVPDAIGCDLPLDNRFSPGFRQLGLAMTGPALVCQIGEHRPGRYAKAFVQAADTVMTCLAGEGICLLWPERVGPTPWQAGAEDAVLRVDLSPFTMTAAGPGGGRWYVQTFNTGARPLRHLVCGLAERPLGPPGEEVRDPSTTERGDGGTMIPYRHEDPYLRALYAEALAGTGITNRMRPDDYA